ncbi:MAG TPA: hypothetical protein VGJ20_30230 [Xanthobacteraceae bacterium]|jgi:hypothetical protein
MQFGIRGVIFSQLTALLSIVPIIFLSGCSTASFADDPHADDVPVNYRTQIAAYMRTQHEHDLLFRFTSFPNGISKKDYAEIADPNRKPIGKGIWVCVRFGHNGLFGGGYPRAYGFVDGQLQSDTGDVMQDAGVLVIAAVCGANPNYKPFPEAEFEPPPQPRT